MNPQRERDLLFLPFAILIAGDKTRTRKAGGHNTVKC